MRRQITRDKIRNVAVDLQLKKEPGSNGFSVQFCITFKEEIRLILGFPDSSDGKESACKGETWVRSLGWKDPLEKGMATHSSILAWRIPRTEATVYGVAKSWT